MLILKRSTDIIYGSGDAADVRKLELCQGSIDDFDDKNAVEFLCVSAATNDYYPSVESAIGKLYRKGLNVAELSKDKEIDLRPSANCWISKPVPQNLPGIKFKRLIVFEPYSSSKSPLELLGNIFAVIHKYKKTEETSVALPMMCYSYGKILGADMLTALFYNAASWQSRSFKLKKVKLVWENPTTADEHISLFDSLTQRYNNLQNLNDMPNSYQTYADSAKKTVADLKNSKKLPSNISERQAFGLCMYTTNYFRIINSTLRANDKKSQNYKLLMPLFEAIDSALVNIASFSGKVYRKDTLDSKRTEEYSVGREVVHLAYTSSSVLEHLWSGNSVFNIQSIAGKPIDNFSAYPSEKEVLFGQLMINYVKSRDISKTPMVFDIDERVKQI